MVGGASEAKFCQDARRRPRDLEGRDSNSVKWEALNSGPHYLDNTGMHLIDWYPGFDPWKHEIMEGPIWIRIYNLLAKYWDEATIAEIGKSLGSYISLDEKLEDTCLGTYIRICLGLTPKQILLQEFEIHLEGGLWIKKVEREDRLKLCSKCRSKDHGQMECNNIAKINSSNEYEQSPIWEGGIKENHEKTGVKESHEQGNASVEREREILDPIVETWALDFQTNGEEISTKNEVNLKCNLTKVEMCGVKEMEEMFEPILPNIEDKTTTKDTQELREIQGGPGLVENERADYKEGEQVEAEKKSKDQDKGEAQIGDDESEVEVEQEDEETGEEEEGEIMEERMLVQSQSKLKKPNIKAKGKQGPKTNKAKLLLVQWDRGS